MNECHCLLSGCAPPSMPSSFLKRQRTSPGKDLQAPSQAAEQKSSSPFSDASPKPPCSQSPHFSLRTLPNAGLQPDTQAAELDTRGLRLQQVCEPPWLTPAPTSRSLTETNSPLQLIQEETTHFYTGERLVSFSQNKWKNWDSEKQTSPQNFTCESGNKKRREEKGIQQSSG